MNHASVGTRTLWASRLLCAIGWYFAAAAAGFLGVFFMSRAGDGSQVPVSQQMFAILVALTVAYNYTAWSLQAGKRWARLAAFPMALLAAADITDPFSTALGVGTLVLLVLAWRERPNDA